MSYSVPHSGKSLFLVKSILNIFSIFASIIYLLITRTYNPSNTFIMKKILYFVFALALGLQMQSCSNDDGKTPEVVHPLEAKYFTIKNAVYNEGNMPEQTTDEKLSGVSMSDQVMNGAMNYVTVVTEQDVSKFYISIKDVGGYYEYDPKTDTNEGNVATRSATGYNTYVIPVMMSNDYSGKSTIMISGQLENGQITAPVETEIERIETKSGALEIKLAFSNNKDIDLHLYTPSDEHIYYGHRGGTVQVTEDSVATYGLDIDSNAGCYIDGINKENIYLPAEKVENGTYKVVVNMFSNCDRTIATNWSIIARYKDNLITPVTGKNPASGIYPVDFYHGDFTEVMTFTITDAPNTPANALRRLKYKPIAPTDMDIMKMEEESFMQSLGKQ